MLRMPQVQDDLIYGIIGNIPHGYRSSHLRNYFSQFLEAGGFECFHFRHRPEARVDGAETAAVVSGIAVAKATDVEKQKAPTSCCVIKVKRATFPRLLKQYARKHWLDNDGASMPSLCIISEINVKEGAPRGGVGRSQIASIEQEEFTAADLRSLPELHPPPMMPQGNVGTPTSYFLELIRACRLPPKVIKSLGLSFPKQHGGKKYSTVSFDYGSGNGPSQQHGDTESEEDQSSAVMSAAGHRLREEGEWDAESVKAVNDVVVEDIESKYRDIEQPDSGEDDDTCEDWERHEAIHDDAGNYERNEERLFEEKIELKWEKGGSGLVFYTDAQVWQKAEGDFDEQTADDWDVDMSVYYDEDGGDMDARDRVAMRKEKRLRLGIYDASSSHIGQFEKYTKGIGRRLLVRNGWKDGERLGKSMVGLTEALECEGQHPKDKKGLGFLGEKVNRYHSNTARLRQAKGGLPVITTIYDNPIETDPPDTLLRRQNPHNLKYRTAYGAASFVKPTISSESHLASKCRPK